MSPIFPGQVILPPDPQVGFVYAKILDAGGSSILGVVIDCDHTLSSKPAAFKPGDIITFPRATRARDTRGATSIQICEVESVLSDTGFRQLREPQAPVGKLCSMEDEAAQLLIRAFHTSPAPHGIQDFPPFMGEPIVNLEIAQEGPVVSPLPASFPHSGVSMVSGRRTITIETEHRKVVMQEDVPMQFRLVRHEQLFRGRLT